MLETPGIAANSGFPIQAAAIGIRGLFICELTYSHRKNCPK
jgi:hypothetical protein